MEVTATRPTTQTTARWWLGATSPRKVIHRPGCQHARQPYPWAEPYQTSAQLASAINDAGASNWHAGCWKCCPGLATRIGVARG